MDLKEIASVSGKGGLYKVLKPTRSGVILETLDATGKKFIINGNNKVSILQEISIYTTSEEGTISLEEVLKAIHSKYGKVVPIDSKSTQQDLIEFIKGVVPNYDAERVYLSDVKKLAGWYNILFQFAPDLFTSKKEAEPVAEKAPAKAKKAAEAATEVNEEKPKKAPAKKTAEPKAEAPKKEKAATADKPAKKK